MRNACCAVGYGYGARASLPPPEGHVRASGSGDRQAPARLSPNSERSAESLAYWPLTRPPPALKRGRDQGNGIGYGESYISPRAERNPMLTYTSSGAPP